MDSSRGAARRQQRNNAVSRSFDEFGSASSEAVDVAKVRVQLFSDATSLTMQATSSNKNIAVSSPSPILHA